MVTARNTGVFGTMLEWVLGGEGGRGAGGEEEGTRRRRRRGGGGGSINTWTWRDSGRLR